MMNKFAFLISTTSLLSMSADAGDIYVTNYTSEPIIFNSADGCTPDQYQVAPSGSVAIRLKDNYCVIGGDAGKHKADFVLTKIDEGVGIIPEDVIFQYDGTDTSINGDRLTFHQLVIPESMARVPLRNATPFYFSTIFTTAGCHADDNPVNTHFDLFNSYDTLFLSLDTAKFESPTGCALYLMNGSYSESIGIYVTNKPINDQSIYFEHYYYTDSKLDDELTIQRDTSQSGIAIVEQYH
ncbi:hypothetical protein M9194_09215 [Vibrio sp. S4M6]|uniref:hypothetical protein n=1 Tax=Vibrio sinus TaxID=2946865 RepID=UPI00202A69CB|nr:hypothetical protein [Vibrio sinus]MCL9781604.1 hypothetical protein [Vibrio sinus]